MPAEKIELQQKQGRLFHQKLSIELNPKHKLYKLRELINWSELESGVSQIVNVKRYGRAKKDLRVMLGLSMLQAMYNFSDCLTSETLEENIYWQYFCGYEYITPAQKYCNILSIMLGFKNNIILKVNGQ